MKKLLAISAAAAMLLALPALADAPGAFRAEYEGNGSVEIDFRNNVSYQNLSVQVTPADFFGDAAGLTVTLLEVDDDDLTFHVDNIQPETAYKFTVNGVREGRNGTFGSITGEFTTPAEGAVVISELDADAEDGEIEIEFLGSVDFENPAVTVTKADGTDIDVRIKEIEGDSIELRAKDLVRGEEYTVTVAGVGQRDSGVFGSASRTVIAR